MRGKPGQGTGFGTGFEDELRRTLKGRAPYFSARWFGRLFAARLSLSDTFWTGMFGVLLVAVPLVFAVTFLVKAVVVSAAGLPVLPALALVLAAYWAVVTRAVIIVARVTPREAGGRRAAPVAAVLLTLIALGAGLAGVL